MEEKEKYINEMLNMKKRAKPTEETGGGIQVAVTAIKGLYPIKGATVNIYTEADGKEQNIASAVTDSSGKTPVFKLNAPGAEYSLNKDSQVLPYSLYNISVYADGFITRILTNIPVFSGVTSLQKVNMVPVSAAENGETATVSDEMPHYEL